MICPDTVGRRPLYFLINHWFHLWSKYSRLIRLVSFTLPVRACCPVQWYDTQSFQPSLANIAIMGYSRSKAVSREITFRLLDVKQNDDQRISWTRLSVLSSVGVSTRCLQLYVAYVCTPHLASFCVLWWASIQLIYKVRCNLQQLWRNYVFERWRGLISI